MLQSLYIENYALISKLEIDFSEGFSVITGETGAGKSILLGAIGLLLGQRADVKVLKPNASRCVVEANFLLKDKTLKAFFEDNDLDYDDNCVIRREINAAGKSRAFINDTPVQLALLKTLGSQLLDIHSQHQNLLLGDEDFQLQVIDILAENAPLCQQFAETYQRYHAAVQHLRELQEAAQRGKDEEDYLRFQVNQLDSLDLYDGKQEEYEQLQQQLEHAEDILRTLSDVSVRFDGDNNSYDGVISGLIAVEHAVASISSIMPATETLAERLTSARIEIDDIANELRRCADGVEVNPSELESVNAWLSELYTVMQKHHVSTESDLMALHKQFQQQLDAVENSDAMLGDIEKEIKTLRAVLVSQGKELTQRRQQAAVQIEKDIVAYLVSLGIPHVQFKVSMADRDEPTSKGWNQVDFLFSANKNAPLQSISQVASGGEIARVMLSLKAMISGAVSLPTIIFDEIDTGVSGHIADSMARIMRTMGQQHRQVISITHLPQIAAYGQHHYRVYKEDTDDGTSSHIVALNDAERVTEIAHMLSGSHLTEAAIENAKALLTNSLA